MALDHLLTAQIARQIGRGIEPRVTAISALAARTVRGRTRARAIHRFLPLLTAIRGTTPVAHLAARAGCSRFAIARWLNAAAQPRLPDFFRCVDAITGRLPDLV